MSEKPKQRVVAIVGRPNVGKSAIFNRLAGRRIAIVHQESGVTRDRLMREVNWDGEHFELIDTGGICGLDSGARRDVIERGIHEQADAALGDVAVAVMVVDIHAGLMPMDEAVAAILRESGVPTIIAVNKADTPAHESGASEFEKLGMPIAPVSSAISMVFEYQYIAFLYAVGTFWKIKLIFFIMVKMLMGLVF